MVVQVRAAAVVRHSLLKQAIHRIDAKDETMKKIILTLSLVAMSSSSFAVSGINPAMNIAKVYEFWMGKNAGSSTL